MVRIVLSTNLLCSIYNDTVLNLTVLHFDMKLQPLSELEGLFGLLASGQLGVTLMCECFEMDWSKISLLSNTLLVNQDNLISCDHCHQEIRIKITVYSPKFVQGSKRLIDVWVMFQYYSSNLFIHYANTLNVFAQFLMLHHQWLMRTICFLFKSKLEFVYLPISPFPVLSCIRREKC